MIIRNRYLLLADIFLIAAAPILSFTIRLDTIHFERYYSACLVFIILALLTKPFIFYLFGLYSRLWRYASVDEALSIIWAVSSSSIATATLIFGICLPFGIIESFPRSVPIIDWLLNIVLIGGLRFSSRLLRVPKSSRGVVTLQEPAKTEKHILIIGAGEAGAMLLREMQANPGLGLLPVGFIDDDPTKLGMRIHNVPVLGARRDIPDIIRRDNIDEVIIAMPTVPGKVVREIMTICNDAGIKFRTIPGIYELLNGTVTVSEIREVRLEDLLRREPTTIDLEEVGGFLAGAGVLVTGAGGSIGAELCRQIAFHKPEQLILLGHGENSIFQIQLELTKSFPSLNILPIVADIRDRSRIERIMGMYHPTVIFHSAAHKHVPLMEYNPVEAITNNVIGTRNVATAALGHGLERFVLISTDKAVNPVSVMGASKRVAELLIQDIARRNEAIFVTVRFGNVLGSRGSVVPLFQRQIAQGGPVTVTHPEAKRFFMTIPEAVQLVIRSAAIGKGGEIFVLDMGEPTRVVDLAEDLIRLSGLEPGRDIDIVFTELRPGEKLCEELFFAYEKPRTTRHEKIFVAEVASEFDGEKLTESIIELEDLAHKMDVEGIKEKLKEIISPPTLGRKREVLRSKP
jgi:FlaA1/EpsC-like NDP-sugar epimerase